MVFFDPVKFMNEFLVTIAVVIALFFIWRYRDRVMLALTGDTKLHGSFLDCLWFSIFQCCGSCNGEWTRCFTMCQCCPKRWRRKNLVRMLGQCLGFTTYTIELKNIVVGDLPYEGRGDFYLCVECSSNPTMVTSLAEDKLAKVVHFPEILTVKIRNSPLEYNVRITVKELHVFGSQDLCVVNLNAMQILDWADDGQERLKRFEMRTLDVEITRETPAWILIEFDEPQEVRELDNLRDADVVRTATRTMTADNAAPYSEVDMATYKQQYALIDPTGHGIEEPLEADLADIRRMRTCAAWCFHFWNTWTTILVLCYIGFRTYVWSCYRRFRWLTMAAMNNGTTPVSFPLSFHNMQLIGAQCEAEVKGTNLQGVPCRPSREQIDLICQEPDNGGHFFETTKQPWPVAFSGYGFIEQITGSSQAGVKCFENICDVRSQLADHDIKIAVLCVLIVLSNCGIRWCCNSAIRRVRADKIKKRSDDNARYRESVKKEDERTRLTGRGGLFG